MSTTPPATGRRAADELEVLGLDAQRLLLAVDTRVGWPLDTLATALGTNAEALLRRIEALRDAGLLDADGRPSDAARHAIHATMPADRRDEVYHDMLATWASRGGPVRPLARALLGTGMTGERVAAACHTAAREAGGDDPAATARFCAAAAAAGTSPTTLAPEWAMACARSGDLNRALALADHMIADGRPEHGRTRIAGAQVAAAALAHRGQLDRSAELYRWSGSPAAVPLAAVGFLGVGRSTDAEALLDSRGQALAPTSRDGAFSLLANGVMESLSGSATNALAAVVRSATLLEPAGRDVLLPDSPAALAALIGLHHGEFTVAESVLERALAVGMGGSLLTTRHRLLLAWIAMTRGAFTTARERLAEATGGSATLELRDWLFAVGLQAGLARRTSDPVALRRIWAQASEAVLRQPVDLFSLLPLGELVTAAARLGDSRRLVPHLSAARTLLRQLGDPPLWSTPLHWSCLHAAVIAERGDLAREHLAALAANAVHCEYCGVLHTAGRRWVELASGRLEDAAVEDAANALHDVGQGWDGAQLAGQAAVRTTDREAMVRLLNRARVLRGSPANPAAGSRGEVAEAGTSSGEPTALLSERERQVAALVLDGLTYRQIGESLFISAKTVEHHVARMRRRLGCENRAQLLELLAGRKDG